MRRPASRSRFAFLLTGLLIGMLFVTPAGAHVGDQVVHLWNQHLKPLAMETFPTQSEAQEQFEEESFVIVSPPRRVNPGDFDGRAVFCPKGFEAISGGVEPANVFTMVVTTSAPVFGRGVGSRTLHQQRAGTYQGATGWLGWVRNHGKRRLTMKVSVTCARR